MVRLSRKKKITPPKTRAQAARSSAPGFLRKMTMLNRMTKMGAVNCSTMALAAVVILLAMAKSTLVRKMNMVPRATHRFIRRG